jgi:hypothetical protein
VDALALPRRAAYRRVIAVLKARKLPFAVGGSLALSFHIGALVDGDLELLVPPADADAVRATLETAGFRLEPEESALRVHYGDHWMRVAWGLPEPLGGPLDAGWFEHAKKVRLLDMRVRLAPLEELIWARLSTTGAASLADPGLREAFIRHGAGLDWRRLLGRLAGFESLVLAHVFLLHHTHPELAREAFPRPIVRALLDRVDLMNSSASSVVQPPA